MFHKSGLCVTMFDHVWICVNMCEHVFVLSRAEVLELQVCVCCRAQVGPHGGPTVFMMHLGLLEPVGGFLVHLSLFVITRLFNDRRLMRFFSDSVVFFLPTCLILSCSSPLPAFAAPHSLTSFPQLLHTEVIYFPHVFILSVLSHEPGKSSHPFLLLYGFMYLCFIFEFHVGSFFFFFLKESTLELLLELML